MIALRFILLVGLGIAGAAISVAEDAVPHEPKPLREFRGQTPEDVTGPVPDQVILTPEAYEAAWKMLGLQKSPGLVDFSEETVFLATTRGSRMGFRLRDEGGHSLQVSAMATRDLRPGLRYLFGVFSKKDWREINQARIPEPN